MVAEVKGKYIFPEGTAMQGQGEYGSESSQPAMSSLSTQFQTIQFYSNIR